MKLNAPDERNLGGRVEINSLLNNHHNALINIKSTINTHIKPKEHVNKNK